MHGSAYSSAIESDAIVRLWFQCQLQPQKSYARWLRRSPLCARVFLPTPPSFLQPESAFWWSLSCEPTFIKTILDSDLNNVDWIECVPAASVYRYFCVLVSTVTQTRRWCSCKVLVANPGTSWHRVHSQHSSSRTGKNSRPQTNFLCGASRLFSRFPASAALFHGMFAAKAYSYLGNTTE